MTTLWPGEINYICLILFTCITENSNFFMAKVLILFTWALALGLSPTFYQQYVRGEEIMGEPRN